MTSHGAIDSEKLEGSIDLLKGLYRTMTLIRITEERIAELVEAKEVNTPCHLYIGQEAIAAGVCAALSPGGHDLGRASLSRALPCKGWKPQCHDG